MSPFRRIVVYVAAALVFSACQTDAPETASDDVPPGGWTGRAVVDRAVAAHGGSVLDRAVVSFDFRGDTFRLRHEDGAFHYTRLATDSLGRRVREVLSNDSLYRAVNGERVELSDDARRAVETRVNSVAYFALLPEPLQDDAVKPQYVGVDTVSGRPYHHVRVTFQQEGGGRDWEDVFEYWFATDDFGMDYLAYAYGFASPDEDAGTRFREAYNVRRVNGVRFADYRNFTDTTLTPDAMPRYPDLLAQDGITLVSTVELDSIAVEPL